MNLFMLLDSTTSGANGGGAGGLGSILAAFLPLIFVFILMYFFMIRPQKKQEQKEAQMRDNLQVGDEVTTIGGIIGRVVSIKDETFTLETSRDRTKIRFVRNAIRSVDVRIADKYAEAAAAEEKTEEAPAEEAKPAEADKKASKKGKKDAE